MNTNFESLSGHFNYRTEKEHITQSFANRTNSNLRHTQNRSHKKDNIIPYNFKHFLFGIFGLILIFYFILDENNSDIYLSNKGYYGSTSKTNLNNFIRYISNEELSLAQQEINNGNIFEIPERKEVILIKSDFGLVKIRFKNESFEFWTVIEAIKK